MIYIAFNEVELTEFKRVVRSDDIILANSDFIDDYLIDNIIDIADTEVNLSPAIREVREFFERTLNEKNVDLRGYANNFFECTIKIVLQYILTLEKYHQDHQSVVFASRMIGNGKLNYYLAEHESQGRILYRREFAMQSTIEQACSALGFKAVYLKLNVNFQYINNLFRDVSVFSLRLLKGLRATLISSKKKKVDERCSTIIILRSSVQLFTVKEFIKSTSTSLTLLCANTFVENSLIEQAHELAKSYTNIEVVLVPEASFFSVIREYFRVATRGFFVSKVSLSIYQYEIDVVQALREILIMSAETNLYQERLESILPKSNSEGLFITCEQKSPHAFIESSVARAKGFKTVQIMSCDQSACDLPYPVAADLFVTDTISRKALFQSNWTKDRGKLSYLGPIKLSSTLENSPKEKPKYDVCYFAHVSEAQQNRLVVEELINITTKTPSFKFCIKLHPRDSGSWLKHLAIPQDDIFISANINNEELYNIFETAITNPSAVVMELLCNYKPFIFLNTLGSYRHIEIVSCDEKYPGYIKKIDCISEAIEGKNVLQKHVEMLHERVFGPFPEPISQSKVLDALSGR